MAVVMLPENAVVLFVHADRVFNSPGFSSVGHDVDVEIVDLTQTVATERKRIG